MQRHWMAEIFVVSFVERTNFMFSFLCFRFFLYKCVDRANKIPLGCDWSYVNLMFFKDDRQTQFCIFWLIYAQCVIRVLVACAYCIKATRRRLHVLQYDWSIACECLSRLSVTGSFAIRARWESNLYILILFLLIYWRMECRQRASRMFWCLYEYSTPD